MNCLGQILLVTLIQEAIYSMLTGPEGCSLEVRDIVCPGTFVSISVPEEHLFCFIEVDDMTFVCGVIMVVEPK